MQQLHWQSSVGTEGERHTALGAVELCLALGVQGE